MRNAALTLVILVLTACCDSVTQPQKNDRNEKPKPLYLAPGFEIDKGGAAVEIVRNHGIDYLAVGRAELLPCLMVLRKAIETNAPADANALLESGISPLDDLVNVLHQKKEKSFWIVNVFGLDKSDNVVFVASIWTPENKELAHFVFEKTPAGYRIVHAPDVEKTWKGVD